MYRILTNENIFSLITTTSLTKTLIPAIFLQTYFNLRKYSLHTHLLKIQPIAAILSHQKQLHNGTLSDTNKTNHIQPTLFRSFRPAASLLTRQIDPLHNRCHPTISYVTATSMAVTFKYYYGFDRFSSFLNYFSKRRSCLIITTCLTFSLLEVTRPARSFESISLMEVSGG